MKYSITHEEIFETQEMVTKESLDVRAITLSINTTDCASSSIKKIGEKIIKKVYKYTKNLVKVCNEIQSEFGIPIMNKRAAITPVGCIADTTPQKDYTLIAKCMYKVAKESNIDLIGGFSAIVDKGFTQGNKNLIYSIPEALSSTEYVCSCVVPATTKAGINMDAVALLGKIIKRTAFLSKDKDGIACGKLAVLCNPPNDNPFMAGAFHGFGEPECCVNVGMSGPSAIRMAIEKIDRKTSLIEIAEIIKKISFKITRIGEFIGKEVAKRLNIEFGGVDLSLAPTPEEGDSVAKIIELIGVEKCGTHGTTAILALLTDSVKKGGAMATSYIGGFSGAFIPVSEDKNMIESVNKKAISIDKLEAMTSVCSIGLDMIAVPGDTPQETISAIIADEMAIGVMNNKSTGVRIIPVPGKKVGEYVNFGSLYPGLVTKSPIIPVNKYKSTIFINRGGRIPPPIRSLTN
jgi:uncharacterized protein (UPF0210 family)